MRVQLDRPRSNPSGQLNHYFSNISPLNCPLWDVFVPDSELFQGVVIHLFDAIISLIYETTQ
jgi:hypothetical protein